MLEQRPLEPSLRTSDELSSRHRDFAGGRLIETRPRIRTRGWPLACGYLGLKNRLEPKPEMKGDGYLAPYALPRSLGEALDWLRRDEDLHDILGHEFITVYTEIKEREFEEFMEVISPWEREHLLLHV